MSAAHSPALLEKPEVEKMLEPPKRWRNWWKAIASHSAMNRTSMIVETFSVGDIFSSDHTWPSKEIAEQKALEQIRNPSYACHASKGLLEYLGAEPEE